MGLNTGKSEISSGRDYTAIGDTTNLAARLQRVAELGAILMSEATSRFLSHRISKAIRRPKNGSRRMART